MKVFFNEDNSHFFHLMYSNKIEIKEQVAKDYIYTFKDTDVTDFAININATISTFDSKVFESYCDRYVKTEENGEKVDFKNTVLKAPYDAYKVYGYDIISVWIDTLREIGIRPWISIRMNDAHFLLEKQNPGKSEYYEKHPEHWRVTQKQADGYYDKCLNYLIPEVREYFLSYIEEALDKYDTDGIELDFTREIYCFPVGMEWKGREVIYDFILEVKKLIKAAELRRNHKIKLSALVWETPSVNYQLGFDVYKLIKDGLIDVIVPIVRWRTIYYDMPIDEWKIITEGTNVELGAGQQELVQAYPGGRTKNSTVEMAFGQAAVNISKGADFVYLYNYMVWESYRFAECGMNSKEDITRKENQPVILNNIGSIDKISKMKRSCVLTYSDNKLYWDKYNTCLPLSLDRNNGYIKISTGDISKASVELILGVETEETILTVYCNGKLTEYIGQADMCPEWKQEGLEYYKFRINAEDAGNYLVFQIYSSDCCTIHWAEVKITPFKQR